MKEFEKEIYTDQKSNCFLALIISVFFIIGLFIKTIYNALDIKLTILMVLPILFLNSTFFILLDVLKNTLINKNVFNNKNKKLLNMLMYVMMIFILSIMIILYNDTLIVNNLYCLILISINFLYSSFLIKKIFDYQMENSK